MPIVATTRRPEACAAAGVGTAATSRPSLGILVLLSPDTIYQATRPGSPRQPSSLSPNFRESTQLARSCHAHIAPLAMRHRQLVRESRSDRGHVAGDGDRAIAAYRCVRPGFFVAGFLAPGFAERPAAGFLAGAFLFPAAGLCAAAWFAIFVVAGSPIGAGRSWRGW
jgi:hypothetical protein